jgi:hypothetical protein
MTFALLGKNAALVTKKCQSVNKYEVVGYFLSGMYPYFHMPNMETINPNTQESAEMMKAIKAAEAAEAAKSAETAQEIAKQAAMKTGAKDESMYMSIEDLKKSASAEDAAAIEDLSKKLKN